MQLMDRTDLTSIRLARILCLTAMLAAMPTAALDWPQWLGPDRDGVSGETDLLLQWPDDGLRVLWRQPLGKGFSAVSVADGRLFTMVADSTGGEFAVCLDASNGKELWRLRTGGYYKETQGGDGPRSTPTVDGETVYVLGAEGLLFAVRASTGETLWQKDLAQEFGSEIPKWGFSTSPLIEGQLLLVEAGGVDGNMLVDMVIDRKADATAVALDKKTGRTLWTALDDKMSYSSPIAYTVDGARQIAFINAYALVGLAVDDGEELWRFPWKTRWDVSAATPLFMPPDRIFISSENKGAVVRVRANGVDEVWQNSKLKNHFGTSIHIDGHLYGFDSSILKCIDASNGEERWKARGYAKGTLISAAGHLIVLGEQGNLGLVEATSTEFVERANVPLMKGRCWTVPSLSDGVLYVRDEEEIVAVDLRRSQ